MAPTSSVVDQLFINQYLAVASFTILYYDYLLTFADELQRYWGHRLTFPAFVFFLNRYIALFGHVVVALQTFWRTSTPTCDALHTFHQIYAVISQILVAILLIVRTYALYGRARWVLWLLCSLAIGAFVFSLWAIFAHKSEDIVTDTGGYCDSSLTANQARWLLVPWAAMLVFDTLVFFLTVRQSLISRRTSRHSLFYVLFRDGAIYFFALGTTNFANICTFAFGKDLTRGVVTTFCNVISETLISRLMLNVRDPALSNHQPPDSTSRTLNSRSWSHDGPDGDAPGVVSTVVRYYSPPKEPITGLEDIPRYGLNGAHGNGITNDIELVSREPR